MFLSNLLYTIKMKTIKRINELIDIGNFDDAEKLCEIKLKELNCLENKSDSSFLLLFNLSGLVIDLAHYSNQNKLAELGLKIMLDNEKKFLELVSAREFFYNLANAKSNLIVNENPFDLTFENIEELIDIKNCYFKALKDNLHNEISSLQLYVNLANILKKQFRLTEAINYYDLVNNYNLDIPQSLVNRSESLLMLNTISDTYSIKMIYDVVEGYEKASESKNILPSWSEYYKNTANNLKAQLEFNGELLEDDDNSKTKKEYEDLTEYRKFFLENNLTLCEHGIYCSCIGSAKDNLTIPLTSKSIGGEFIPKMELILNRIKSEYSLSRHQYYEYLTDEKNFINEDCFTELLNSEMVGLRVEKLRSSFRLCFGVLDKIALAICELYELKKASENIYFHNFWRLNNGNRREKFESIKNPGLLALYSIATDLNEYKNGEWSMFKKYRNALEHGFLVITDTSNILDVYESFLMKEEVEIVNIVDFEYFIKHLLQLTRSAIFSFVFCVRNEALKIDISDEISIRLEEKKFC